MVKRRSQAPQPSLMDCDAMMLAYRDNTRATLSRLAARYALSIQDIPGCEPAKRAMEVAAIGDHRVAVVGGTEVGAIMSGHLVAAFAQSGTPVKAVQPQDAPDITVVVHVHDCDFALPPPAERTTAILDRITSVRAAPWPDLAVDHAGKSLLAEAKDRMSLSDAREDSVIRVARTIAAMDRAPRVLRRHIAEALSYVRVESERKGGASW